MTSRLRLGLVLLCGAAASVTMAPGRARADERAAPERAAAQEWVGVELMPASLSIGSHAWGAPERVQVGVGGTLRLLRRRWTSFYVTPIEAGVYVTSEAKTILAHAMVEVGYVAPGPLRRLEIGLAGGVGVLAMDIGRNDCDGRCNIGGAGPIVSPVVRYRIVDQATWTLGAALRGVIPLREPDGDVFGYFVGRGAMVGAALDLGFGAL
jgi:hypothetical protein